MQGHETIGDIKELIEIIRRAEHFYEIKQRYPNGAPANVKERDLLPKAKALRLYAQRLGAKTPGSLVTSKVYGIKADSRVYADALEAVAKDFESL